MKIEVLSGEVCNLYGDLANIRYLKACVPQAQIIDTALHDTPLFASQRVDMVYLGPMSENFQIEMIKKLLTLLGVEKPQLAFEQTAMAAYYKRLREYHDDTLKGFDQGK